MSDLFARYEEFIQVAASNEVRVTMGSGQGGGVVARLALAVAVACVVGAAPIAQAQEMGQSWTVGMAPVVVQRSGAPAMPGLSGISARHREIARGIVGGWCAGPGVSPVAEVSMQERNFECRKLRGVGQVSSIGQMGGVEMVGSRRQNPVFVANVSAPFVRIVESTSVVAAEAEPMIVLSAGLVQQFERLNDSERKAALEFLVSRELALSQGDVNAQADFRAVADAVFVAGGAAHARGGIVAAFEFLGKNAKGVEAREIVDGEIAALDLLSREIASLRQSQR